MARRTIAQVQAERDLAVRELQSTDRQLRMARENYNRALVTQLSYKAAEPSTVRKDYRKSLGSSDNTLGRDRDKILRFSRNLYMASGVYRGFVRAVVDLVVGTGLVPIGKGRNSPADRLVEKFMEWADAQCDARGMEDFGGFQRLILSALLVDGDIGGALASTGSLDAVQVVESDLIITPPGARFGGSFRGGAKAKPVNQTPNQPTIVDGVELGDFGRPVAYHVAEWDQTGSSVKLAAPTRVPADQMFFLTLRDRASQTRGLPHLVSCLDVLSGIDEMKDAVEVATKVHAHLGVVVKTKTSGQMRSLVESGSETTTNSDGSTRTTNLQRQEPGTFWYLEPDEDIATVQGSQPTGTFDGFCKMLLRLGCGGGGMPVEIAMGDFSDANFSVARMAELYAQNTAAPIRRMIQQRVCCRVFNWWVSRAVLRGEVVASEALAAMDVQWRAPKREWMDPAVEIKAAIDSINANLSTYQDECAKRGIDWEETAQQRAKEKALFKELNIEPPMLPGAKTGGEAAPDGAGGPTPPATEPDDDAED